jgi:hypothetical protein
MENSGEMLEGGRPDNVTRCGDDEMLYVGKSCQVQPPIIGGPGWLVVFCIIVSVDRASLGVVGVGFTTTAGLRVITGA